MLYKFYYTTAKQMFTLDLNNFEIITLVEENSEASQIYQLILYFTFIRNKYIYKILVKILV